MPAGAGPSGTHITDVMVVTGANHNAEEWGTCWKTGEGGQLGN
jgi:hypothetical protein